MFIALNVVYLLVNKGGLRYFTSHLGVANETIFGPALQIEHGRLSLVVEASMFSL